MQSGSQVWSDHDVSAFTETDFNQNFRMSGHTFGYIDYCQCLSTRLSWQGTHLRGPTSLREHIRVVL